MQIKQQQNMQHAEAVLHRYATKIYYLKKVEVYFIFRILTRPNCSGRLLGSRAGCSSRRLLLGPGLGDRLLLCRGGESRRELLEYRLESLEPPPLEYR